MAKTTQIKVRDDTGRLYVILEIESLDAATGEKRLRLELANRAEIRRISDKEFEIVQTGQILTRA